MASTSSLARRCLRVAGQFSRPVVAAGDVPKKLLVSGQCCWPTLAPAARRGFSCRPACCQMQTTELYEPRAEAAVPLHKAEEKVAEVHEGRYKERHVTVHACADLFREWKRTRPGYKYVNEEGVSVPLSYIHTGLDRQAEPGAPVVFALHGAPGSYREFDSLVPVLDAQGAAVVVPTMPDLEFSMRTQSFWHSVEERTDLIKKFLKTINVREIDMLVAHSSSMYPTLQLALNDPEIKVNSLVFIAPPGCRRITQLSPYWMMKTFDNWFRVPWLQNFLCNLAVHIVRVLGKPNNNQIKGTILSMITIRNARFDEAGPMVRELKRRGVPMLMLYGERDKLIDREVSEEMAAMMGVQPAHMHVFQGKDDAEAVRVQTGKPDGNCEVVCFKQGTHYAFKKYPGLFNDFTLEFWRRNKKSHT
ncbi:hypothetical protein HPB48_005302 [Haemaphysalis longicornis]|uniref:Hydrolase/acyltransferase n=1 Tax=Haemaphysalis longicornis TaxID=44386 RepID=A0A9J6GGX5_HAELO|nr:hypothetical protein HPB48_005302 [Haemaphysalis longicornis]